jgi:predicted MFS family arabinose efflux permease
VANLTTRRMVDSIGSRKVLLALMTIVLADFLLLPLTSSSLWTAVPAILI